MGSGYEAGESGLRRMLAIGLVAGRIFHFDFEGGMLDILMQQFVLDLVFQLIDKFHSAAGVDDQVGVPVKAVLFTPHDE